MMDEILPLILQARSFDADVRDRHRAFGELVVRFQDMAYGVAYSMLGDAHLAQDAAQEAFLAAYRELGKLREPKAFAGWLRRIVLTQCNRMTRRKRVSTIDLEAVYGLASGDPDPAVLAEEREMKDQVLAAIRDLPEHERTVTMLFYISGYSQKEIADFLDLPLTTVKKRLQYARRRLKEEVFDMAIQKSLREERPSKDERFAKRVRLFQALEADDTAGVAALLQEDATLIHESIHREVMWSDKPMAGASPLHLAADYGHKEIVAALIFFGTDVNVRDQHGRTPLHCVAGGCASVEVAELLLKHGADLHAEDKDGTTPLLLAARCTMPRKEDWADHWGMAQFLLMKGSKLDLFGAGALDKKGAAGTLLQFEPDRVHDRNAAGETPLHWAARSGSRTVTQILLDHGADINARDGRGRTPLHGAIQPGVWRKCEPTPVAGLLIERGAEVDIFAAAMLGDLAQVDSLFMDDVGLVNALDGDGASPLCLGTWHGQKAVVERLLNRGADVGIQDVLGRTAVSVRFEVSDYDREITELLLEHGAQPDLLSALVLGDSEAVLAALEADSERSYSEAMDWAIFKVNHPDMVALLLDQGVELNIFQASALGRRADVQVLVAQDVGLIHARDEFRCTVLHRAAEGGHLDVVADLMEAGADVNARSGVGATPLHLAVGKGHEGVARQLLDGGADLHAENYFLQTPLFDAVSHGDPEQVNMVLALGADVNVSGTGEATPLHWAAGNGHAKIVEVLLERRADIEARNHWGGTPFHVAAQGGHSEVCGMLLKEGAELHGKDDWGRTPLHVASWHGHGEVVGLLLDAGASLESTNMSFSRPLDTAAASGHVELAALLLEKGAKIDAQSDFGRTALHTAARAGHREMIRFLLERGAGVDIRDNRMETPLHWAVERGDLKIIELLLENGADMEARNERGRTVLHLAAWNGHPEVATFFLKRGMNLQVRTERGNTPLHTSIQGRHPEVAMLLLERGADVHVANRWGSTPLHSAAWYGLKEVAEGLVRRGADPTIKESQGKTPAQLARQQEYPEVAKALTQGE